jgi:uncharacterized protein (TIGR02145 family)
MIRNTILLILLLSSRISSSQTVKDIDGNVYGVQKFGDQMWMTENLKVIRFSNGDSIPMIEDRKNWELVTTAAWCYYQNKPEMDSGYGKLYNWYAVTDKRHICPEGFHMPDSTEWQILSDFLGGNKNSGGKLKSAKNWKNSIDGETDSGFNALPAGNANCCGFFYFHQFAYFWTTNQFDTDNAFYRFLSYKSPEFNQLWIDKNYGLSCRCVKDK